MSDTATLRHTGLRVPDLGIRMIAPGLIEVDGETDQITIDADDDWSEVVAGPGQDRFYQWAMRCLTPTGDPVDLDDVFDFLRAEYVTGRALARAAADGCTVVQAMLPSGEGYMPAMTLQVWPDHTRQFVIDMTRIAGGPPGTWWRLYDGVTWVELDPK